MLITIVWSPNKFEALLFATKFFVFTIAVYTFSSLLTRDQVLNLLIDCVYFSSLCFCVAVIYQRYWQGVPYSNVNFSPIGFVNYLGQVLNIWIPILVLAIYKNRHSVIKVVTGGISLIVLVHLLVESNTRGTILGLLGAELLVLLVLLVKNKRFPLKYITISAMFGAAVVTFSIAQSNGFSKFQYQVLTIKELNSGRETVFRNTIDMIAQNPAGIGVNNFEYIHQKYAKMGTPESSPYVSNYSILPTPYNIILKLTSELGLLGGSMFLVLLSWLFIQSFMSFLKGNVVDVWVFMAVFSVLFHAMFSSVFLTPVSLFFSLLLFSVVISRAKSTKTIFFISRQAVAGLCLSLIFLTVILSVIKSTSSYLTNLGYKLGDTQKVEKALEINPYNYIAAMRLVELYLYKEGDQREALNRVEYVLSIYPYNVDMLIKASEIALELELNDKSEYYKEKVLEIYPDNERIKHLDLAR
nr:O-antigen ligase family protein [Pseudoalteromonas luteoviolacea]